MSVNAECDGKNCHDCTIERRNASDQIIADLNEFMQKTYGFNKSDSEDLTNLPIETSDITKIKSDFAKAIENGNLDRMLSILDKAHKEGNGTFNFTKQVSKTKDEIDFRRFEKAIQFGYIEDALNALNSMQKRDTRRR